MKTTIKTWQDLREGDVWLGMTVNDFCTDRLSVYLGESAGVCMDGSSINAFIKAGNNTVERKPENVEFETVIHERQGWAGGSNVGRLSCLEYADFSLGRFIGKRVKVTIEPLD